MIHFLGIFGYNFFVLSLGQKNLKSSNNILCARALRSSKCATGHLSHNLSMLTYRPERFAIPIDDKWLMVLLIV